MTIEIRVPALGESVSEATIGRWFKKAGETVKADEPLVELETDKVTLEVNAPSAGVLSEIAAESGTVVKPDALLGAIAEGGGGASGSRRFAETSGPRRICAASSSARRGAIHATVACCSENRRRQ